MAPMAMSPRRGLGYMGSSLSGLGGPGSVRPTAAAGSRRPRRQIARIAAADDSHPALLVPSAGTELAPLAGRSLPSRTKHTEAGPAVRKPASRRSGAHYTATAGRALVGWPNQTVVASDATRSPWRTGQPV